MGENEVLSFVDKFQQVWLAPSPLSIREVFYVQEEGKGNMFLVNKGFAPIF